MRNNKAPKYPQGLVVMAGGEKKNGSVRTEGISGLVVIGWGNLYSGYPDSGRKRGKFRPGKLPKQGNEDARGFLLAWTLPVLENVKAMKKTKTKQ